MKFLSDKLFFMQIHLSNLRKKGVMKVKSLSEREKYILALVDMNLDKLKSFGNVKVMNEYLKEAKITALEEE